jgi:hypothetical protein
VAIICGGFFDNHAMAIKKGLMAIGMLILMPQVIKIVL